MFISAIRSKTTIISFAALALLASSSLRADDAPPATDRAPSPEAEHKSPCCEVGQTEPASAPGKSKATRRMRRRRQEEARIRENVDLIGDAIRREVERTARDLARDLARLADPAAQPGAGLRDSIASGIQELQAQAEDARTEAERWLEEAHSPSPEERARMAGDFKKRVDELVEGAAALDRETQKSLAETANRMPAEIDRFRRELEDRLGPKMRELRQNLRSARGELRRNLGLAPLPDREPVEAACDDLQKMADAKATDFALRMLETPQGRVMAERAMRMMREGERLTAGRVEKLQEGTEAMQKKIASLESQLTDLRKCLDAKLQERTAP